MYVETPYGQSLSTQSHPVTRHRLRQIPVEHPSRVPAESFADPSTDSNADATVRYVGEGLWWEVPDALEDHPHVRLGGNGEGDGKLLKKRAGKNKCPEVRIPIHRVGSWINRRGELNRGGNDMMPPSCSNKTMPSVAPREYQLNK